MERSEKETLSKKEEEDGQAIIQMWKYIFGFSEMAAIKCAIELQIADIIEDHGSPMTLPQLSSTLNCSLPLLHRILRFLVRRGIFKEYSISDDLIGYAQTPLSRLLATKNGSSLAPFMLLEASPAMLAAWHNLSAHVKSGGRFPFEAAHGMDVWGYAAANPKHNRLINEAMGCSTGLVVAAILDGCQGIFDGVGSLVDVGGGNGATLSVVVKACSWIRGINFDLSHVVSTSPVYERVEHVAGDMFDFVPNADAAFIKWTLHDWNDEECITILKNCKEAIPKNTGKVIIVDAVIDEKEETEQSDVGLMLDLVMMAHTSTGKERTRKEWEYVINAAGFSRFTVTRIQAIQSVIECFP
ncbi:Acetylserotonin O-methyltransferase, partial [Cucurbita argyrosperma subsp. sororia]